MNLKYFLLILTIVVILISTTLSQTTSTSSNNTNISFNVKYYAIRTDLRKCAFPKCGGYFLKELNTNKNEIYVSKFIIQNGSPQVNEDLYRNVLDYQIIVYGTIISSDSITFEAKIIASKIYRYIENLKNDYNLDNFENYKFYNIIQNSDETKSIIKLNVNSKFELGILNNNYDEVWLIQKEWLNYKIMSSNALFTSPSNINNNKGNVTIDHLFIGLPDPICPRNLISINCKNDTIPTYTRSANRCESFSGCVTRGACPLLVPQCPKNYKLTSIPSKPHGCNKHYCDPNFL